MTEHLWSVAQDKNLILQKSLFDINTIKNEKITSSLHCVSNISFKGTEKREISNKHSTKHSITLLMYFYP